QHGDAAKGIDEPEPLRVGNGGQPCLGRAFCRELTHTDRVREKGVGTAPPTPPDIKQLLPTSSRTSLKHVPRPRRPGLPVAHHPDMPRRLWARDKPPAGGSRNGTQACDEIRRAWTAEHELAVRVGGGRLRGC